MFPETIRTLGKTKQTVSLGTIHKVYNVFSTEHTFQIELEFGNVFAISG